MSYLSRIELNELIERSNVYNDPGSSITATSVLLRRALADDEKVQVVARCHRHRDMVLASYAGDPPVGEAIADRFSELPIRVPSIADWVIKHYQTDEAVRAVAKAHFSRMRIEDYDELRVYFGLVCNAESGWDELLRPDRLSGGQIENLIRLGKVGSGDTIRVLELSVRSLVDYHNSHYSDQWMSELIEAAMSRLDTRLTIAWCQDAIVKYADQAEIWRPCLLGLADYHRAHRRGYFEGHLLTTEQSTALADYWYERVNQECRSLTYELRRFVERSGYAVPSNTIVASLMGRRSWTWLGDELIEAGIYRACARADASASSLWDHTEDRVTSRLLDQLESELRDAQSAINDHLRQNGSQQRIELSYAARDMRFGRDVAGADLAIVFSANAPGLQQRCAFILVQAKKPSGQSVGLNDQLSRQIREMLYHSRAAYVAIYPDSEEGGIAMIPAGTLQAAGAAGATNMSLSRVWANSRSLAQTLALDLPSGWIGDERYGTAEQVVSTLENNVRPRRLVQLSVRLFDGDDGDRRERRRDG